MTKDEALKLALEALKNHKSFIDDAHIIEGQWHWIDGSDKAITAIKEALANIQNYPEKDNSEQEPFGWYSAQEDEFMMHKIRKEHARLNSYTHKVGKFDLALYTTPPQRKPLTFHQISEIYIQWDETPGASWSDFARAIEATHGIKE